MWTTNNAWEARTCLAARFMTFTADDLARFHNGDRRTLASCYEEHFDGVFAAVGTVLHGADRETVVHEVFLSLLDDSALRKNFQGGSLGAWLRTVARNRAIDHHRKFTARERALPDEANPEAAAVNQAEESVGAQLDAKNFLERILMALPNKWLAVFEARFINHLTQREAAALLQTHRTTLAYQELQIRRLLRRLLKESRGT